MNVVPHFVVPDAAEAAVWYARAFGAVELSRVPLPTGAVMPVALRIGDSELHIASEFPVLHPIADQFWGDRQGQLTDPFGHRWNIAQHIRDLSPDEIAAAAAERFGG